MDSDSDFSDFEEGEVPPLLDAPPGTVTDSAPQSSRAIPSKVWENQMPVGEEEEEQFLEPEPVAPPLANRNEDADADDDDDDDDVEEVYREPPPPSQVSKPKSQPAPAKSTGGGGSMKKGFLNAAPKKKAAKKVTQREEPEVLRPKQPSSKQDSLRMDEVQQALKDSMPKMQQDKSWVNDDLMKRIAADPLLRKAFTDPVMAKAMDEVGKDPKAAMAKYQNNPEVQQFILAYLKVMGEHFSALGDKQEQEQRQKTPEEVKAEQIAALAKGDPEVMAILSDPRMQNIIQNISTGNQFELDREMQNPEVVSKLQKLSKAGLIQMNWAP